MSAEPSGGEHPLAAVAHRRRADTRQRAAAALQRFAAAGTPVTFEAVAAEASVSRAWLYNEVDVRDEIFRLRSTHRRLSPAQPVPKRQRASDASLAVRLQTALARNWRLAAEVAELREQLAAAHGHLRAQQRSGCL